MDLLTGLDGLLLLGGAAIAFGSGILSGYAGFGGALILTPILAMVYGPVEAVSILVLCLTLMAVTLVPSASKSANWTDAAPIIIAGTVTAVLGAQFLVSADPVLIKRGMGVFVTLAALALMTGWSYNGPRSVVRGSVVGAVSGGIFGAFGVPAGWMNALYFMSQESSAKAQRANIIVSNMSVTVLYLGALILADVYDSALLLKAAVVAPLFLGGVQVGKLLFAKVPSVWFKRVARGLLLATGLAMLSTW